MDFRRTVALTALVTAVTLPETSFALKYDRYFPTSCPELNMSTDNLIEATKDLTKVANRRGKLMARIKRNQDLADSGILLEEYFRKRGLKVSVRNLSSADAEGVYNAVRADVYKMTSMYFEAKIYAAKIESLTKELGSVEKVIAKDPELFNTYRTLIVQMTEHFENYKIVTQFLRKASGTMTELKDGVVTVIDYSDILANEYIRRKVWSGEIEGKVVEVDDALREEARRATAGKAEQYKTTSRRVLELLAPNSEKGLAKEYRNAYPKELNPNFTRIPFYTEIRNLIQSAGMDMEFYLLKRQDWYQRLAIFSMFRPTRVATAGIRVLARKMVPRSKFATVDAFIYSLENLEAIAAHDAAIQGVLDFKGTLVEKGYELLARNGDKDNAMLARFATRDDLAWEWEMLKVAAEKATPPNRRLLAKMDFAEKMAAKLDGSSGKVASAKRRIIDKAIDSFILGGASVVGVGHLTFSNAEITTRENDDENNAEPTPNPEEAPTPAVENNEEKKKPDENKPDENLEKKRGNKNREKKNEKDTLKTVAFNEEVSRRVKARFANRPPQSLSPAEVIEFDQILEVMDPVLDQYLKDWVKTGHSLNSAKVSPPHGTPKRSVASKASAHQ